MITSRSPRVGIMTANKQSSHYGKISKFRKTSRQNPIQSIVFRILMHPMRKSKVKIFLSHKAQRYRVIRNIGLKMMTINLFLHIDRDITNVSLLAPSRSIVDALSLKPISTFSLYVENNSNKATKCPMVAKNRAEIDISRNLILSAYHISISNTTLSTFKQI
jgi:hypothetical protein